MKRRKFTAGILSLMLVPQLPIWYSCTPGETKLNVLVLGGTNFLGPALVNALLAQGHKVTLFNRGLTNPQLFPELQKLRGDREQGIPGYLQLESSGPWDLVIDVWPENPNLVEDALRVLKDKSRHYMFVSSIAVYHNYVKPGTVETAKLREGDHYEEGNYNLNKRLCEKAVEKYFPNNFTIVRPGAIVGDRDPGPFGTDLLNRIAERDKILAPDSNDPVQLIDAADIGRFLTLCAEKGHGGYYNLVGPNPKIGYKDLLLTAKKVLNKDLEIVWIDSDFLVNEMKLEPFVEIPFWIPVEMDPEPGFYQISNKKALAAGLIFKDMAETVRISYDSVVSQRHITDAGSESFFGISEEREEMIIEAWYEKIKMMSI